MADYLYYGTAFPASFAAQAQAKGATALVELEPWHGGGASDCSSLNGAASYYAGIGTAVKNFGHPVILTWGHEMNVSGQYPWATGNGCGFTAAQWKSGWTAVVNAVRASAGGFAYFMWAPGADTCPGQSCTTHNPSPWWPDPSTVDLTAADGYPAFCDCGTFAKLFAPTFKIIQALPGFSSVPQQKIFVAETDLAPLGSSGYESMAGFVSDLCKGGGDGVLQFQDGTPALTSAQWSQLSAALAADCSSGPVPVPTQTTPTATPTVTPTATPTVTPTPTPTCKLAAPVTAPAGGFDTYVNGRYAVPSWNVVAEAAPQYEVRVFLPDGTLYHDSTVPKSSATYSPVPELGTYTYKVRARNCGGAGPWSALQSFAVTR